MPEQHDDGAENSPGPQLPAGLGAQDFDRVLEIVSLIPRPRAISPKNFADIIADEPPDTAVEKSGVHSLHNRGEIRPVLRTLVRVAEFRGPPHED